MRRVVELLRSPPSFRPFVAVIALSVAGCSAETSRFESPLSNPFARSAPAEATNSVQSHPSSSRIESRPLPQASALPPPTRSAAVASNGMSGGGRGLGTYQPNADVTGSIAHPPKPVAQAPATAPAHIAPPAQARGNWDWDGGTAVTVAPGETVDIISSRYGVPSTAIAQANGLHAQAALRPGQRLVIPRYNFSHNNATTGSVPAQRLAQSSANAPARPAIAAPVAAASNVHVVAPGDTLTKIARTNRKSVVEIASANNIAPHTLVKMGDRIVIPGARAMGPVAAAAPRTAPIVAAAPVAYVPAAAPPRVAAPAQQRVVSAEPPTLTARVVTPAADNPAKDETGTTTPDAGGAAGFRWPVRGRIITGFGPKPTGQQNDGINLAVPEGTPVKAAEDGVVAYAGSELKGYGNLVLVRHSNGYVTAYAHASELMVKRGDAIKRGQVIAKSGQTGNVTSPQLHFEVRKGSTPVDPMPHLTGN